MRGYINTESWWNKMKNWIVATLSITLVSLAGCTTKEIAAPIPLVEVTILTPNEIVPEKETIVTTQIKHIGKNVDDADDVQLEVWKLHHQEQSDRISANYTSEGLYEATMTFAEDGIYYVQAHVTVRNMHVMPKKVIIVGDVSEEELKALENPTLQETPSHSGSHH
jgi:hypothetical protein